MNLLFLIALSYTCFNQGIAWNFRDFKEWERIAPLCATGKKQSPINLSSDYVKINSGKQSIKFSDYNSRPSRVKLENDGYTVTANFEWQGKKPKVSGAALSDEVYNLYNAHCHWSTDNYNGTEHSIRGEKYAAEFHLVHLNAKYKTPEEARANSDGVAVVTILFEVNDSEDPHEGMQLFAALTQTVINPRTTSNLSSIDVASMLPDPFESFYSYKGSLTTPPCTENVHWLIVSEPQCVTSKSMEAVRRVVLANNDTHNIRPPQNRSNRVVKLYDHDSDYGKSWNYQNFKTWKDVAPLCNEGKNQSPIDLVSECYNCTNTTKPPIEFINYCNGAKPSEVKMQNNGHTIQVVFKWKHISPKITGSVLSGQVYSLFNAHIHWSTGDTDGTEHSIEGQKYATELHLVHINEKYKDPMEAIGKPDGFAVIGLLFEVNDKLVPHAGIEQFASISPSLVQPNVTNTCPDFKVGALLPTPFDSFYSYKGSLTTPPCTENVHWIVVAKPQPVTSAMINAIRCVTLANGDTNNIRPLQKLNGRLVEFYKIS